MKYILHHKVDTSEHFTFDSNKTLVNHKESHDQQIN